MQLENMTPSHLRCSIGGCPAVYQKENGNYVIVGKKLDTSTSALMSHKIAPDEYVIEIGSEYLYKVLPTSA